MEVWSASASGAPVIQCARCARCGKTMFPPQAYGCTGCGAFGDTITSVGVPARGTLLAFAVVQMHDKHPVPFTLGDLELEGGPIVRVELAAGASPRIGDRLSGRVVEDESGRRLEFAVEGAA